MRWLDPVAAPYLLALALAAGALEVLRRRGQMMELAVGAGLLAAFALPALLGDPSPARTALALILGAGAVAVAHAARTLGDKGETFEIASWEGGLGGGSRTSSSRGPSPTPC